MCRYGFDRSVENSAHNAMSSSKKTVSTFPTPTPYANPHTHTHTHRVDMLRAGILPRVRTSLENLRVVSDPLEL